MKTTANSGLKMLHTANYLNAHQMVNFEQFLAWSVIVILFIHTHKVSKFIQRSESKVLSWIFSQMYSESMSWAPNYSAVIGLNKRQMRV